MSQRAICLSLRDKLQELFSWDDSLCDKTVAGRPKPLAGEFFVAVHEGGYRNRCHESLDEIHSVLVTVTYRTAFAPSDEISQEVLDKSLVSLTSICEQIKAKIHSNPNRYDVLHAANRYILEEANKLSIPVVYGFCEPLFFESMAAPTPRGPAWFYSKGKSTESGLSLTIKFDGARRLQAIEKQT